MATTNRSHKSLKYAIIDKDSTKILVTVGIAAFVVIFCLFAMKALLSQSSFNGKVISAKETALSQLEKDKKAADDLRVTYDTFVGQQQNILGGSSTGTGPIDGNNAQLIIDALPGNYDFPALSSSIEKILKDGGYRIDAIGGADQGTATTTAVSTGGAVEIPYSFSVSASVENTKNLLDTLERSIRPISVTSLGFQSTDVGLRSTVGIKTFYAPAKVFELGTEEIK
jgi:hypothetical protein